MSKAIYNLISSTAWFSLHIVALFHNKTSRFLASRKANNQIHTLTDSLVFHCASLGEYEELLPFIRYTQKQYPKENIVLTFFSNSGLEVVKKQTNFQCIYLPWDGFGRYKKLISALNPKLLVIGKYEFWVGLLNDFHKAKIPIYHVNTTLQKDSKLFKFPLSIYKKYLSNIDKFYTADKQTLDILLENGLHQSQYLGDSRITRALDIVEESKHQNILAQTDTPIIVYGSTYTVDEDWIYSFIKNNPNYLHIIAPHETNAQHIGQIHKNLPTAKLWSQSTLPVSFDNQLIVDGVGFLKYIYPYATITYIGGAIDNKVHNILEASVFGIPVIFGPNHQNMPIAQEMIDNEFCKVVSTEKEFTEALKSFRFTSKEKVELEHYFQANKINVSKVVDSMILPILNQ